MILKQADDKSQDIAILEELLQREDVGEKVKKNIKDEIWKIRTGIKGEKEAAYDLKFYLEERDDLAIIHDLRLEINGNVAQIDHIIINCFLDVWVIETKNYSNNVIINDLGEFSIYLGKFPKGIPSPIEQNEKHLKIIKDVFGSLDIPSGWLFSVKPRFYPFVLFSNNTYIKRPKSFDTSNVMKIEQFNKKRTEGIEHSIIAPKLSIEELKIIGHKLIELHTPLKTDWFACFGIPKPEVKEETPEPAKQYYCSNCKAAITPKVAKFCWDNKPRFKGRAYCFDCQKGFA